MKQAAIGVRVHSGWGALVAVSDNCGLPGIVERKHITIIDHAAAGTQQPYHFAEKLAIQDAEKHLAVCAVSSGRLARAAIESSLQELRIRGCNVAGCAMLLASGRALPALSGILASHALIHTAEGEFFRKAFRDAFAQLRIPVSGFRERDLKEQAAVFFGNVAPRIMEQISSLGRVVGPPWTADEKNATLAAWMLLNSRPA